MPQPNPRRAVDYFFDANESAKRGDRQKAARLYRRAGRMLLKNHADKELAAEMFARADRMESPFTENL